MARKIVKPYFRVPKDESLPLQYYQATIDDGYDADGIRRRVFLRSKDKSELLDKIAAEKRRIAEGVAAGNLTVSKWFEFWLEEYVAKGTRPKNAAGNRSVVKNHILPAIGRQKLRDVDADSIRRVTNGMLSKGLSSTYALNAHNIMSAAFDAALRERKISLNPATLVKRPRKEVAEREAFTLDEALLVLEHVTFDPVDGARWATSMLTGARRGEVIGIELDRIVKRIDRAGNIVEFIDLSWQLQRLTWQHGCEDPCKYKRGTDCLKRVLNVPADFEYRHLTGGLYLTRPKSRAGWRMIPVVGPLKVILDEHRARMEPNAYGLLFTKNGEPRDPDQDSAAWKRVLGEVGIDKNVVLHGLRNTAVDLLYLAGVPEDIIQEIVGHSTRAMTRGYKSRMNVDRLVDAMDKFGAQLTRSKADPAGKRELEAS